MTPEEINRLLEKYWAGDTSLDEELALKTFFSGDSVPENLRKYQPIFVWKTKQSLLRAPRIGGFEYKKSAHFQWDSILKIAASVLLMMTVGIGFYTHYEQEKYLDKVFSETYSNPEDALQATKNVIGKISSVLNMAKDKRNEAQKLDSLEQTDKDNTME